MWLPTMQCHYNRTFSETEPLNVTSNVHGNPTVEFGWLVVFASIAITIRMQIGNNFLFISSHKLRQEWRVSQGETGIVSDLYEMIDRRYECIDLQDFLWRRLCYRNRWSRFSLQVFKLLLSIGVRPNLTRDVPATSSGQSVIQTDSTFRFKREFTWPKP
jgi:hypothetical protein